MLCFVAFINEVHRKAGKVIAPRLGKKEPRNECAATEYNDIKHKKKYKYGNEKASERKTTHAST